MTVPAVVAVVGGVLAAVWSGLILRLWVGWIHVPGHPNRAVFGRPVGVILALVAPPLLLSLPWLAEGPAWARPAFIGIWLALFLIVLGLNAEDIRDATARRRRVHYTDISLRVTRRRVAFMLATFCWLGLLIAGAVTFLLALMWLAPPSPDDEGARFIDAVALAAGAFAGMIVAARVARALLVRVGRVSPTEADALTRERD